MTFGQIIAIMAMSFLCLVLIGGFAWLNFFREREAEITELGCPVSGATGMTAVIIDATDPISEITLTNLRNEFRREISQISKGQYLRIASLTGTPWELPTMFDGCNPGDGQEVDIWTNNPQRRQERWEEAFGTPLEQLPESFGTVQTASQSPIMAAIQKMRNDLFDSDIAADNVSKRIIIVSDMIEHTDLYSQYRTGPDFEAYLHSDGHRTYRTDLSGIEVTILYVDRASRNFGSAPHMEFWARWIDHYQGKPHVRRLEGLN